MAGTLVRMISVDGAVGGIAASNDLLVVGVTSVYCLHSAAAEAVQLFSIATGDLIRSFGEFGSAEGHLEDCFGIRFTLDGTRILIADSTSKRLSLFTLTGEFVRSIGVGVFNDPTDVTFTRGGEILVADADNRNRICVFSSDGSTLLRSFGCRGDAPGQFKRPNALEMRGDKLFVLDQDSARVQVFK